MELIWEKKENNITHYLLRWPLTFFLIVINTVLTSWIFHVSFAIFTDAQEHMTLFEWMAHLYAFLKL